MSGREVWVTGLGAVTAVGTGAAALLDAMRGLRSGLAPAEALGGLAVGRVQEVPRGPLSRRLDRSAALFLAAAEEAWSDAGLESTAAALPGGADRCGVSEGSSLGPLPEAVELASRAGGRSRARPSALVRFMTGAGGAALAQARGLQGPVHHLSAGSVSAASAIGEAFLWIASGRLDVAVAGGGEAPLRREVLAPFVAAGVLAAAPDGRPPCRPFDPTREGTVFGEGGGALVLEAAEHARRRGAAARAILRGYGLSCEAHSMVAPDPEGSSVARAVRRALGRPAEDPAAPLPGWVKAHGTGTPSNDAAECRGLAAVFGRRLPEAPLAGLKPLVGHCLGASGAVEAVAAALALQAGIVPPTLGTERVDPDLPPCVVAREPSRLEAESALLLSEGFGGRCAALLVGRAQASMPRVAARSIASAKRSSSSSVV